MNYLAVYKTVYIYKYYLYTTYKQDEKKNGLSKSDQISWGLFFKKGLNKTVIFGNLIQTYRTKLFWKFININIFTDDRFIIPSWK